MNDALKQAVDTVIATMKQDYINWSTNNGKSLLSGYQEVVDNWNIEIPKVKSILNLLRKTQKSSLVVVVLTGLL